MAFRMLGGGSSLNQIVSDVNTNILELRGQEVTKVIRDEQGIRVVVLDKNGLRTTEPGAGIDVITADDEDFTFNSSRNTLKVVSTGELTIPARNIGVNDGYAGTYVIPHGQSSIPKVLADGRVNNTVGATGGGATSSSQNIYAYSPLPYKPINSLFATEVSAYEVTCLVDETNVYISYLYETNGLGGYNFPAVPVKYRILQETAN